MKLLPRSLLWRTFLLVALLMMLSVAAWFAIFRAYEREPRARQLAQTLVSVVNLTRAALISARPEARRGLLRDLSDREGIHIYPADAADRIEPLPDRPFLQRVEELVQEQMGEETRLTLEREGERALFVNFRIDDSDEGAFWLALPRERIERVFPLGWLGWGVAALLLSLVGAWVIVFRITRPLKALQQAARKVGAGGTATLKPRRRYCVASSASNAAISTSCCASPPSERAKSRNWPMVLSISSTSAVMPSRKPSSGAISMPMRRRVSGVRRSCEIPARIRARSWSIRARSELI